jgi:hypothetical protein
MTIDEIANSLIKSVKPIYKSSILWNALRSLERQINTPLQLVLAEAENYIRKLSIEVSNEIKRKKELNEYYCYDY